MEECENCKKLQYLVDEAKSAGFSLSPWPPSCRHCDSLDHAHGDCLHHYRAKTQELHSELFDLYKENEGLRDHLEAISRAVVSLSMSVVSAGMVRDDNGDPHMVEFENYQSMGPETTAALRDLFDAFELGKIPSHYELYDKHEGILKRLQGWLRADGWDDLEEKLTTILREHSELKNAQSKKA